MKKIKLLLVSIGLISVSSLALAQGYPQVKPGDTVAPGTVAQLSVADTGQTPEAAGVMPVASSQQPLTRPEVKQDLRQLEQVGYNPDLERANYPTLTQQAERRETIKQEQLNAQPNR